jgi:hypothetical protein
MLDPAIDVEFVDISSSLIPDLRLLRRSRSSSLIFGAHNNVIAFVKAKISNTKAANTMRYNLENESCTNALTIVAHGGSEFPLGLQVLLRAGLSADVVSPQHWNCNQVVRFRYISLTTCPKTRSLYLILNSKSVSIA